VHKETVEIFISVGEYFVKYGAWGICTILFFLLVGLYLHMSKKHVEQEKVLTELLEKRNNQLLSLIQKCSTAISNSSNALEESSEVIKKTQEIIEESMDEKKEIEILIEKMHSLMDICLYTKRKE
jgi:ABC-type anion transport system duplicated permease subunit